MKTLVECSKNTHTSINHTFPEYYYYIASSLLDRFISNISLPSADGAMRNDNFKSQPYKSVFKTRVRQYISAVVEVTISIKLDLIIETEAPLALTSRSIDTILSTQTLEHMLHFRRYLAECRRLLRPGGQLILTVPMQWCMHEVPFDYWQFPKYGVLEALEEQGLEVFHLSPCGGAWALLGQLLNSHLAASQRGSKALFWLINRAALWMDKRLPDTEETIGWIYIAKAPSPSG